MNASAQNASMSPSNAEDTTGATSMDGHYVGDYVSDDDYYAMLDMISITDTVYYYCRISAVIIGLVGNCLCLVVLMSKHFRKSSAGFLMIVVALIDIIALLHLGFVDWLAVTLGTADEDWGMFSAGRGYCKVYLFVLFFGSHLSSWTVVTLAAERLIVVCFPMRAKVWVTRKKIALAWLSVCCVLFGINSVHFYTADNFPPGTISGDVPTMPCDLKRDSTQLQRWGEIFMWIDYFLLSGVPVPLIIIFNFIVIRQLRAAHRKRAIMSAGSGSGSGGSKDDGSVSSFTVLMIAVSVLFAVTTSPICLYTIVESNLPFDPEDFIAVGRSNVIHQSLQVLHLSNHTFNFVFYCIFGSKFRAVFVSKMSKLRRCIQPKKPTGQSSVMTNSTAIQ